ncbi:MAG: sulfatase-like hydrolase/transferase [Nitrospinales bacterium]
MSKSETPHSSNNSEKELITDKLQLLLASVSVVLLFVLLPVFQFMESNPHFYFEYSMDHTLYGLIIICFGLLPIVCLSTFVKFFINLARYALYAKIILGLTLLLFLSQLYTKSIFTWSPFLKGSILFPIFFLGIIAILKKYELIIWGLAWLLILVLPATSYHAFQRYFYIPKIQRNPNQNSLGAIKDKKNIFMIFLDGCEITSSYLDNTNLPKKEILPNFRKFLKNDAHWFPNSLSNAPATYLSYPTLITGKLHSSSENHYLIHEKNIFSILKPNYKINTFLSRHSSTSFCLANPRSCDLSGALAYFEPMKSLFEMWVNMSTFKRFSIYFQSEKIFNDSYGRSMSINHLMERIKTDPKKGSLNIIQLFDREEQQIRDFDKFFGNFINALKNAGKYKDSIIIIMSDHGFNRDPIINYGRLAKQTWSLYKVPYAIKTSGTGNGKIYNYKVQSIDIAPTLLARILPSSDYSKLQFDGVDVLMNRPNREHYINLDKKDIMFQLADKKEGGPEMIEIPLDQVKVIKN